MIQALPHSSAAESRRRQENLIWSKHGSVRPSASTRREMFQKRIIGAGRGHRRGVRRSRWNAFLNREEAAIININFMRNLSLAAQMLMCSMIIQKEAGG